MPALPGRPRPRPGARGRGRARAAQVYSKGAVPWCSPGIHRIEVTTLGDLLDLRAAEHGKHLAMVFPSQQVSYAGLAARSHFFARGLLAAGLKPGETVGILLPNCVDAIATLFGAAKAGLYPVPVNARYKSLELADLIRHSRMRARLHQPARPVRPGCALLPGPADGGVPGRVRPGPHWAWTWPTPRTCARSWCWARTPRPV